MSIYVDGEIYTDPAHQSWRVDPNGSHWHWMPRDTAILRHTPWHGRPRADVKHGEQSGPWIMIRWSKVDDDGEQKGEFAKLPTVTKSAPEQRPTIVVETRWGLVHVEFYQNAHKHLMVQYVCWDDVDRIYVTLAGGRVDDILPLRADDPNLVARIVAAYFSRVRDGEAIESPEAAVA